MLSPEIAAAASAVNAHMITLRKQYADTGKAVETAAPQEVLELLVPFVEAAERELVTGAVQATQAVRVRLMHCF